MCSVAHPITKYRPFQVLLYLPIYLHASLLQPVSPAVACWLSIQLLLLSHPEPASRSLMKQRSHDFPFLLKFVHLLPLGLRGKAHPAAVAHEAGCGLRS